MGRWAGKCWQPLLFLRLAELASSPQLEQPPGHARPDPCLGRSTRQQVCDDEQPRSRRVGMRLRKKKLAREVDPEFLFLAPGTRVPFLLEKSAPSRIKNSFYIPFITPLLDNTNAAGYRGSFVSCSREQKRNMATGKAGTNAHRTDSENSFESR